MDPRKANSPLLARVPFEHPNRPGFRGRSKYAFIAVAILLSTGWLAVGSLISRQPNLKDTAGPLADVHAIWEDNCTVCHDAFQPIGSTPWMALGNSLSHSTESQAKCESCHSGPPHYENQSFSEQCADCHVDHRGRKTSLVDVADQHCTRCHEGIEKVGQPVAPIVADFATHPPFLLDQKATGRRVELNGSDKRGLDPGQVNFSHALHMSPGIQINSEGKAMRYGDIHVPYAADYMKSHGLSAKTAANDLVQLRCVDCHRLDSGDTTISAESLSKIPGANTDFPRSNGQTMLPINFDRDCRGCHQLSISMGEDAPEIMIPHRLQPAALESYLAATERYANDEPPQNSPLLIPETIPRKKSDIRESFAGAKAREFVMTADSGCIKCHVLDTENEGSIARILPTNIPNIWFKHARFDHKRHRLIDCRECHGAAFDGSDRIREDFNPFNLIQDDIVMLPDLDSCKRCHHSNEASPGHEHASLSGQARSDCVVCHTYHNGQHPLAGRGATARHAHFQDNADEALKLKAISIEAFLRGEH